MVMKYDIFLSYKSEDHAWVENIKISLQKRGVSVWLDKHEIRPGDLFAQALENGIQNSRAIAVIVTPQSMKSKWVQEEFSRALSLANKGKINIIPCVLQQAKIPGFLSSRHYIDFTDESLFDRNIDKLVFPGITGKTIHVESFTYGVRRSDWLDLQKGFYDVLGNPYISGLSPSRMSEWTHYKKHPNNYPTPISFLNHEGYTVVVIDMTLHGVLDSAEFILECRNSKESELNNIVFVFYHPPDFFKSSELNLPEDLKNRFSHYYVIEKTLDIDTLKQNMRTIWNSVMQDLMRNEQKRKK